MIILNSADTSKKRNRKKGAYKLSDNHIRLATICIEQWGMTIDAASSYLAENHGYTGTPGGISGYFKRTGMRPKRRKINQNNKRQCKLCRLYFIEGLGTDHINKHLGLSGRVNASDMLRQLWPDFDFRGYATMRRHGIKPWTQIRDEYADQIERWHVVEGFGSRVITKKLGINNHEQTLRILKSFDWYDPSRAKANKTMARLGIRRIGKKSDKPEWQLHLEQIEKEKRSKRTRMVNDLPLFDFAMKERQREKYRNTPRTDADRKREMDRYYSDPVFWIKQNCRKRLNKFVNKTQKVRGFENYTGCTPDELRDWLESQFEPWMNWNNKGKWHIDHIVPCSSFDLADKEQQAVCFNWRNLRPLDGRKNISKGDDLLLASLAIASHQEQEAMRELVDMVSPFVSLPAV
jgi:hypothetical protein